MYFLNGSIGEDDRDAMELFPHTTDCMIKMSRARLRNARLVTCTCPARQGRKNYLYLIRRARRKSYIDAYAKIRHEAKQRAERAQTPVERQVFEEVAAWAESLELGHLETP